MNTQKIASTISNIIGAEIKPPEEIDVAKLSDYDLVGFGSGIYFSKHHKVLLQLVDKLQQAKNKKAFIFSTSGQANNGEKFHRKLREKLLAKGYIVISEFNCPGYDTFGALRIFGGIQKGHPNEADLKTAEAFAQELKQKKLNL